MLSKVNKTYSIIVVICFGLKKTNREISTAGGEVIYLLFQKFFYKLSFGQRPRQCLNKSYSSRFCLNKIYLSTDEVFDCNLVSKKIFLKE